MGSSRYIPSQGDVVSLAAGRIGELREEGASVFLVLTTSEYNRKAGLMLCCPVVENARGYPFEVPMRSRPSVKGAILSDQVRSLDWQGRMARKTARAAPHVLRDAISKLRILLEMHPSPVHEPD